MPARFLALGDALVVTAIHARSPGRHVVRMRTDAAAASAGLMFRFMA